MQNSTEKVVKDEQALENRCPSCTASISFNPKIGKWKCEYCGNEFTLEEMQQHNNNASTKKNNTEDNSPEDSYDEYISYKCESCGAEIVADSQTAATFCVYCGNTAILKSKLSGKFTPTRLIPFKTEKQQAIEAFKGLSKGRPLMPKHFNDAKNIEKIKGVYIPFWLYDININGNITMSGEIITSWSSGNTHYTKTDKYELIRGGNITFNGIPVDASTRFDNDIMTSLEPFDFKELIKYNHAYLSGFFAERYDQEGEIVFKEASERAMNTAKDLLEKDASRYTNKIIKSNDLVSQEAKKEYIMLPVWMVNVKYKDQMYTFAMNGQTGEFVGNIPLDKTKTIIYTIVTFLIVLVICTIICYYIGG